MMIHLIFPVHVTWSMDSVHVGRHRTVSTTYDLYPNLEWKKHSLTCSLCFHADSVGFLFAKHAKPRCLVQGDIIWRPCHIPLSIGGGLGLSPPF